MSQEDVEVAMIFGPETALRLLQQSATHIMRANERLMRGMTDVANCQVELGQTLLQHHLYALQSGSNKGSSSVFSRGHIEYHRKRMEYKTAAMQKAMRAITVCFREATQELLQNEAVDGNSASQISDKPRTSAT
jgi:hypothetical protein